MTAPVASSDLKIRLAGGGRLPDDFLRHQTGRGDFLWNCRGGDSECGAALVDLNGDGQPEIVVLSQRQWLLFRKIAGRWTLGGTPGAACDGDAEAIAAGRFTVEPPSTAWRDLVIQGRRLRFREEEKCPQAAP